MISHIKKKKEPFFSTFLFFCFLSSLQIGRRVDDLFEDLRDGHNLVSLLEVLSGDHLVRILNEKRGKKTNKTNLHIIRLPNGQWPTSRNKMSLQKKKRDEEVPPISPLLSEPATLTRMQSYSLSLSILITFVRIWSPCLSYFGIETERVEKEQQQQQHHPTLRGPCLDLQKKKLGKGRHVENFDDVSDLLVVVVVVLFNSIASPSPPCCVIIISPSFFSVMLRNKKQGEKGTSHL